MATMFDGVGDGLRQGNGEAKMAGTVRGREGGARRGNQKPTGTMRGLLEGSTTRGV
jgi:hypothetical protein